MKKNYYMIKKERKMKILLSLLLEFKDDKK